MADNASRRGATDLSMPLAILAAVVIGGFFFWLNAQVQAERALEIVEDTTETEEETGPPAMAGAELQGDLTPLEGQEIRVQPLPVADLLGTQGFWIELPGGNPFLVSMSEQLRTGGTTVEEGERAAVTGVLHAVNDSVLTAWTESGSINENDRLVAEFATHFIEATGVRTSPGPGGAP